MEVVIHCGKCNQALRVPSEASGHEARCPACREMFTIPPLDSTLEETITEWIVQDVEEMLQSKDRQVEHVPARQREPVAAGTRTKKLDVEADGTARRRLWGLRPHQPAQPDEPARDAHRAEASSPPDRDRPTHADRHPHRDAAPPDGHARGYPTNLQVTDPIPHLIVQRVNTAGVRFAFDAAWLKDERFRASMPMRCAFTGEDDRDKLMARPIVFADRLLKTSANVDQIAAAHTVRKLSDKHPRKIVQAMGRIEALPEPFCYAMPCYVSTKYAHHALHAQTLDRSNGEVTCAVLIPDPPTALRWLGRVNGVCGPEFELLERDVSLLHGNAWRELDDECRGRLDVWCKLDPDEKFRGYFNDADFGSKEAGLAGVVVTDRKLIFNKHHRKGHVNLNRANTNILVQLDGRLAHLTLEHDGERHRMVTLRAHDLESFSRLLDGATVQVLMV